MAAKVAGCYFSLDCISGTTETRVTPLCQECRDAVPAKSASYWDFKDGCGPWNVNCSQCDKLLWEHVSLYDEIMEDIDLAFAPFETPG